MNIITRNEAMKTGALRYFTGKPCPYGHISERYVKTWQCVECISAYAPNWAKNHPMETKAIGRNWRQRNPDRVRAWKSAGQKRNRAAANKRNARYIEAHREKVYAKIAEWAKANPGRLAASTRRRQAAQLQRTPPWADHDAITGMYELAAIFRSVGVKLEVDHEIPLRGRRVSGLHVHDNLRLIHSKANKVKANHF